MKTLKCSRVVIGFGIFILVVAAGSLFFIQQPKFVTTIKVIDENGRPIAGATIKPNGLRSKNGPSAFGWNNQGTHAPKPKSVQTNAKGEATIAYPRFVMERVETGTITFVVEHPDFAAKNESEEQVVDYSPRSDLSLIAKARIHFDRFRHPTNFQSQAVVLKRGGVVKASGFFGGRENIITTNIFPQPKNQLAWETLPSGILFSKRFFPGINFLRLIYFPEQGKTCFSDLVSFKAKSNVTNEFSLELKPGKRVQVRLDDNVPRPVRNGRVVLKIGNNYSTDWRAWRKLEADGTCIFESLPTGTVEIVGICDGYISSNGAPPTNGSGRMCVSQKFTLNDDQDFEMEMEPAAICKVLVLDSENKPLAGSTVMFWPNVIGTGGIFARRLVNSDESVRAPAGVTHHIEIDSFSAETDANGLAVIKSLPGFGQQEIFAVEHPKFEMPSDGDSRYERIRLRSGETSTVTVIMEKRGAKPLEYIP